MKKSLYMKILVPVDGSDYSTKALIQACNIAKSSESKVYIIFVAEKSPTLNLLDRKEFVTMLRNYGKKVLQKAEKIAIKEGIASKQVLKEGNVVNEITKYAKNEKCNLIVIGNKGLGATARFFLGSVSNKLANSAPCSVLIVK